MEKEKENGFSMKIPIILVTIFVVIIGVIIIIKKPAGNLKRVASSPTIKTPTENIKADALPETAKAKTITNPEYLKNPSAYVVDYEDVINDKNVDKSYMWVEDIKVGEIFLSYIIEKEGKKIIKLTSIINLYLDSYFNLPRYELLENASDGILQCWKDGTVRFMQSNFLHKRVKSSQYSLLAEDSSGNFTIDIYLATVSNGYGVPSFSKAHVDTRKENDRRGMFTGDLEYQRRLLDLTGIAALEKRGLWGTCK